MKKLPAIFALLLITRGLCLAQAGSLDPTFSGDGIVTTSFGSQYDLASCIYIQPDGKIVAGGYTATGAGAYNAALARYHPDGSLDATFGTGGKVSCSRGEGWTICKAITGQADGKILVAGYAKVNGIYVILLLRFLPNGTLDTTFDTDGILTTAIGQKENAAYAIALQTDGKILVSGYSYDGTLTSVALVRYHSNGTLDATFGGGGVVSTLVGQKANGSYSLAIESNGKIAVCGYASDNGTDFDILVLRYTSDGTLDNTFSNDGIARTHIPQSSASGEHILVQPNGKYLVTGYAEDSKSHVALARYGADGALDASFGSGGLVLTDLGQGYDEGISAILQPDGKIVVGGFSFNGTNSDFAMLRYLPNGAPDNNFSDDGKLTTPIGDGDDYLYGIAMQSNGSVVAAGVASVGSVKSFALVRYLVGQSTDTQNIDTGISGARLYPNPLQTNATLEYQSSSNDEINIRLFDTGGRELRVLAAGLKQNAGLQQLPIDGAGLPSGLYFLSIEGESGRAVAIIKINSP